MTEPGSALRMAQLALGSGVCVMFDAQSTFALAATSLKGKF